jgi:hypothetical protein
MTNMIPVQLDSQRGVPALASGEHKVLTVLNGDLRITDLDVTGNRQMAPRWLFLPLS